MNNLENCKLSHIFNLPNLSFKTQMNIAIDSNAHIKSIINIQPYIFDCNTECVTSKCEVKGKIGVKILYIDIDNVYNTLTDELTFAENVSDANITSDVKAMLFNEQISTTVDFDDKFLKINFAVNAKLIGNIDLGMNVCDTEKPDLMLKKKPISSCTCSDQIFARTSLDTNIKLPYRANKILNIAITPTISKIESNSNYMTVSGSSVIQVIYDVDSDTMCELKCFSDMFLWKYEIQANCNSESIIDTCIKVDSSTINFTTELNDTQTDINLEYEMVTKGFVFNTMSIDHVEDLYSTNCELETNYFERDFDSVQNLIIFSTSVDGELQLKEDNQIDEIVATVNHSCLITQSYTEQKSIVLEGVLLSNLIYMTEQREIKSMTCELPFSISKDFELDNNCQMLNFEITPTRCKTKVKRGNTLSLDYELSVNGYINKRQHSKVLDSIKQGKSFEYGDIAFQITVAKPNETVWDFCKRTHTSETELREYNKEIPPIFQGGEKVIIYR